MFPRYYRIRHSKRVVNPSDPAETPKVARIARTTAPIRHPPVIVISVAGLAVCLSDTGGFSGSYRVEELTRADYEAIVYAS